MHVGWHGSVGPNNDDIAFGTTMFSPCSIHSHSKVFHTMGFVQPEVDMIDTFAPVQLPPIDLVVAMKSEPLKIQVRIPHAH